jgi:hypothetical protein
MGSGITHVTVKGGMDVVVLDRSLEDANKAVDYSRKIIDKAVSRGKMTKEAGDAFMARITPTDNYDDLKDVDLIIEAVFERPDVKADVIKKLRVAACLSALVTLLCLSAFEIVDLFPLALAISAAFIAIGAMTLDQAWRALPCLACRRVLVRPRQGAHQHGPRQVRRRRAPVYDRPWQLWLPLHDCSLLFVAH